MGTGISPRLLRLEAKLPAKDRDREPLIINRVIVGPRRADEPEVPDPPQEVSRTIPSPVAVERPPAAFIA